MHTLHYPKLLLLGCSFIAAYGLYHLGVFDPLPEIVNGYGYLSIFLAGLLFSFGFTTAFGIAVFVAMGQTVHPILAAFIGATGALLTDLSIFQFARVSLQQELHELGSCRLILWLKDLLHPNRIPQRWRAYLLWSVAGLVIASPLPDEIGVTMLSGIRTMKRSVFMTVCYTFNAIGIFAIILGSRLLRA